MKCVNCGSEIPEGKELCGGCEASQPVSQLPSVGQNAHPATPNSGSVQPRVNPEVLVSILIVVWLGGTLLLSLVLLSGHVVLENTVIEPQSHYSARYYVYGVGMLQFDLSIESNPNSGSEARLLVLTEGNYENFVSGKSYGHIFSLGTYGDIHGNVPVNTGVVYVVVVNDVGQVPITIRLEYDMNVYFSVITAVPVGAAAVLVYSAPRFIIGRSGSRKIPLGRKGDDTLRSRAMNEALPGRLKERIGAITLVSTLALGDVLLVQTHWMIAALVIASGYGLASLPFVSTIREKEKIVANKRRFVVGLGLTLAGLLMIVLSSGYPKGVELESDLAGAIVCLGFVSAIIGYDFAVTSFESLPIPS